MAPRQLNAVSTTLAAFESPNTVICRFGPLRPIQRPARRPIHLPHIYIGRWSWPEPDVCESSGDIVGFHAQACPSAAEATRTTAIRTGTQWRIYKRWTGLIAGT